jgi:mannose-6-phosphate isomerase-like protein (cupin superfamily)
MSRFAKTTVAVAALCAGAAFVAGRLSAQQQPQPSCRGCESTYIPASEIAQYMRVGLGNAVLDQQMRAVDIGKAQVEVALVHRGKLDAPAPRSVATHDLVSEVYYIISGSGTNRTGPNVVDPERRPPDDRAVQLLNGPGANGTDIRNAAEHELEAGDVLVIPAGTGHQFTKIDDHITYLMIRIDPDKVVPLMDEADSREYLEKNRG